MIEALAIVVILALDIGLVLWVRHCDRRTQPVHHQGARRLP